MAAAKMFCIPHRGPHMLRVIVSLLALSTAVSGRPDTAGPSRACRLAYVYKGDIWTANGDGTGKKLLVKNGHSPCWSPDKKRVAFARNGDIWVIKLGERIPRRLTINWKPARTETSYGEHEVDITWDPISGHLYFSHWETFLVRRPTEKTATTIPVSTI